MTTKRFQIPLSIMKRSINKIVFISHYICKTITKITIGS